MLAAVLLSVITNMPTTRPIEVSPSQSIAEAIKQSREPNASRRIVLSGGVYELTEPIVLTPLDSGLTIETKPGEQPILSGGRKVRGWHPAKFNGHDCWAATAPVEYAREMWLNDR